MNPGFCKRHAASVISAVSVTHSQLPPSYRDGQIMLKKQQPGTFVVSLYQVQILPSLLPSSQLLLFLPFPSGPGGISLTLLFHPPIPTVVTISG